MNKFRKLVFPILVTFQQNICFEPQNVIPGEWRDVTTHFRDLDPNEATEVIKKVLFLKYKKIYNPSTLGFSAVVNINLHNLGKILYEAWIRKAHETEFHFFKNFHFISLSYLTFIVAIRAHVILPF